jgi:spermidine synthase
MIKRIYAAIGLLSASLIAFQLVLMQILAITQWHHFAYMVISVALLGFGAAGTVLSLFRTSLTQRFDRVFPVLLLLCGATMSTAIFLSQYPPIRFDSYLLFTGAVPAVRLMLTYAVFFIPFLLAALALGLVLCVHRTRIGVLYFCNLAGSGTGALFVIGLMWVFQPQEIPPVLALFPILSGLLTVPRKPDIPIAASAILAVFCVTAMLLHAPTLKLSEFKGLSRATQLPGASLMPAMNSPYGVLQVFSSPALRYAPGLSLTYPLAVSPHRAVFINGDWAGAIITHRQTGVLSVMDFSTTALPYVLEQRRTVLVLNMSTGMHVDQAVGRGVAKITAVEPNPVLLSALAAVSDPGSLMKHPAVIIKNTDSRNWLLTDQAIYDMIVLPTIDTFGGTAGLDAIREHFLFTQEAFGDAWRRLSPRGVLSVTCWMDYPPRHALRMLATIVEMLAAQGIDHPEHVITAVRSWGTITFMVKKTPYNLMEIENIRTFCAQMKFDPALLPGIRASERTQFNILQDDLFFKHLDQLLSPGRRDLFAAYDFNIAPATDDRPYFAQFLRWESLAKLSESFGRHTVPFFEIGYLVVFLSLLQTALAAVFLILTPLICTRTPVRGGEKALIFLYFSGIGIGYIFVEMAMIQRFSLYFGNPLYAAAIVIGVMLTASGMGSLASANIASLRRKPTVVLACIILLLLAKAFVLTPLLLKTMIMPMALKIMTAFALLSPAAFLMGIPFPAGIGMLRDIGEIPWAWGVNSCLGVVSTTLATIVAVSLGFKAVLLFAALAYGCTWMACKLARITA